METNWRLPLHGHGQMLLLAEMPGSLPNWRSFQLVHGMSGLSCSEYAPRKEFGRLHTKRSARPVSRRRINWTRMQDGRRRLSWTIASCPCIRSYTV